MYVDLKNNIIKIIYSLQSYLITLLVNKSLREKKDINGLLKHI